MCTNTELTELELQKLMESVSKMIDSLDKESLRNQLFDYKMKEIRTREDFDRFNILFNNHENS